MPLGAGTVGSAGTAGVGTVGAAGTAGGAPTGAVPAGMGVGVDAGRMTMTTTRMEAISTTTLMTMTSPSGTEGFLLAVAAGVAAADGTDGAGITGAGAALIMRVKSLGPVADALAVP